MTDMINVPYEELFRRATNMKQQADTIRQEVARLNNTVSNLAWMGVAATRFRQQWEQTRPMMEAWARQVQEFADRLEADARRMQQADNTAIR